MAIWAADVCSRAARQLICIEPTGLRLRRIGKTDPQCGTVQFCFHSGRLTCSARIGFRTVTSPLVSFKRTSRDCSIFRTLPHFFRTFQQSFCAYRIFFPHKLALSTALLTLIVFLLPIFIRFRYLNRMVANRKAPSMCPEPCGTR